MQELKAFIREREPVNLIMIAANILVFIGMSLIGDTQDASFMLHHGAGFAPLVQAGEYYRIFTSMFLHFGLEHLIFNMLLLLFLGDTLERVAGKMRYLLVYLGGGLAGNLVSYAVELHQDSYAVSAGASGAIFAVLGALVYLVVRNKGNVEELSGQRLLLLAGLSIVQGFTASGVDSFAHLGGFAGGFLIAFLCGVGRRNRQ